MGVVTLGISTEVKTITNLAGEAASALKTSKPALEALARAERLIESANVFAPARKYLDRLYTAYREGRIETSSVLKDIEKAISDYPKIYERMRSIDSKKEAFEYLRVIPKKYFDETKKIFVDLSEADVMTWHGGMRTTNGRYSIGGSLGREALYTMRLGKDGQTFKEVEKIAVEEAGLINTPYHLAKDFVSAEKLLDLTDEAVRIKLGIKYDHLVQAMGDGNNAYQLPQVIGDIAKDLGFTHVLAPSVLKNSFDSLIHLAAPSL
ncbi:MAG: hypothetical protein EOP06_25930 [Proteobacteria bacterium]|nr:MAG: hypothetical protein EOP06_25930 [Pseudomonadota bacterium]